MPKIHPTAVVSPQADLADDVEVGPGAVIEGDVTIGAGTRIGEYAIIRRYTSLGRENWVDAHTVIGGLPQDFKFRPSAVTHVRIGDGNVFREGVTISRGTTEGEATIVGNRTFWMTTAHAGHGAVVGDEAILTNGAALAGHSELGYAAILSAYVLVHQFCWVGERVMSQGNSGVSMHVPPFTMIAYGINRLVGLNVVGLRRAADLADEDRRQIREAFNLTYRSALTPAKALERMDACSDWGAAARRFRDFLRRVVTAEGPYRRGLCPLIRARRRARFSAD